MTERKNLSLCMITKNDEKYLSDCLQDLKEVVDEIIIADIGSNDQTVAIAKQAGANVYQIKWENDYSTAKNFCLDQANGRWILFLQANEHISAEHLQELKLIIDNPNAEGYLLYIDYNLEGYNIFSPTQALRLFRNRKEYRYRYKSFELIPDDLIASMKNANIQIVQRNDSTLSWEFSSRVLLLQEEFIEHPEDSYIRYMYGLELLNHQKYDECIMHFQMARKNINFECLFAPHLYKCLGWSCLFLQRYADALDALDEGINNFPFYTDLLILRAEVRYQLKQYEKAVQDLESCLKIRALPNFIVPGPEIDDSFIFETLGEIHEQTFNYIKALACYQQAYKLNNKNRDLLYNICELARETNENEVMEKLLKASIEEENFEQLMILIDALSQQREYSKVLAHMDYLEELLGKGEQTESIKLSCRMMLGEVVEDFSAIKKKSSFYNDILLRRIQNHWFHDQWSEAEQLLQEMNQTKSIDPTIKVLYRLIHRLFSGENLHYDVLTQKEYEIVNTLYEDLLWVKQVKKAKMLLPLLLKEQEDDCCIKLAKPWAQRNNYQIIKMIFQSISNKEKQKEFKRIIIEQLLRNEHIGTAEKLMKLGDSQPLEGLEYILWSKSFMQKLEKWLKIRDMSPSAVPAVVISFKRPDKPSQALLGFYHSLDIAKNNMDENALENIEEDPTSSQIHEEIGDFYKKAQKKNEALSAYLRALQWDPQNECVQEKIRVFSNEDSGLFHEFLEKNGWISEGSWFNHKQDFIYYVQGLIAFKNQHFEQSLTSFSQIAKDEMSYPIALAYIISSLWLDGKEKEAEIRLDKYNITTDFIALLFNICKSYAICKLSQNQQEYPYFELIQMEKEWIQNKNFC